MLEQSTETKNDMNWKSGAVIAALFLVAIVMAVGNRIYQTTRAGAAVEYWTKPVAALITQPSQVEVWPLELEPEPEGQPVELDSLRAEVPPLVQVAGQVYRTGKPFDVSTEPGLTHFRRALLANPSYDWEARPETQLKWRFALRFANPDQTVWMLLSQKGDWIAAGSRPDTPVRLRRNRFGDAPFLDFLEDVQPHTKEPTE